jgi:hypothetical protein
MLEPSTFSSSELYGIMRGSIDVRENADWLSALIPKKAAIGS